VFLELLNPVIQQGALELGNSHSRYVPYSSTTCTHAGHVDTSQKCGDNARKPFLRLFSSAACESSGGYDTSRHGLEQASPVERRHGSSHTRGTYTAVSVQTAEKVYIRESRTCPL